jgi:hypothetical protein
MNIHSTKQSTVRTGASRITQSFPAKQLQELASEELPNFPQTFIVEKQQKLPKGKSAFLMNEASFMSPPVSNDGPDDVTQQRHTRGLYSPTKIQESSASCAISRIPKSRKNGNIVRNPLKSRLLNSSGFLLLMLLNIMGMVQALTDCQIMKDWLPSMFSGTGTSCCSQTGIKCFGASITEMFVKYQPNLF